MNYEVIRSEDAVDDVRLLAVPAKSEREYFPLDDERFLDLSMWAPKIEKDEAATVTVRGTLLKVAALESESVSEWARIHEDDSLVSWDTWETGDTDPPFGRIHLSDGRTLEARSWAILSGQRLGTIEVEATFYFLRKASPYKQLELEEVVHGNCFSS